MKLSGSRREVSHPHTILSFCLYLWTANTYSLFNKVDEFDCSKKRGKKKKKPYINKQQLHCDLDDKHLLTIYS